MYNGSIMLLKKSAVLVFLVFASLRLAAAQDGATVPVDEIIRKFAAKEKEFQLARANYVYRQEVKVQELDANDRVLGEYALTSDIGFDEKGKRTEKIVHAPPVTLGTGRSTLQMTPEDLQDIQSIQPFVLTTDDVIKYNIKYVGKEKIDEIDCYAFEVGPKKLEKGQRYFEGKIWVDDRDLQIVKTYGKAVPDLNVDKDNPNLFPRFETYREQIDEFWFPTYTRAADTLNFPSGKKRIRQIIRYGNYKKFQSNVNLTFGDAVEPGSGQVTPPSIDNKAPALDPKYKNPPAPKK
jgi:outer membrane lipoprotein-sorting protein